MKVVWTDRALEQVREIFDYIARDRYRVELDRVSVVSVRHTRRDADANAGSSE